MNSLFAISLSAILLIVSLSSCNKKVPAAKNDAVSSVKQQKKKGKAAEITSQPAHYNYDSFPMPDTALIIIDTAFLLSQIDSFSRLIENNPEQASFYARRADVKIILKNVSGACDDYKMARKFGGKKYDISLETYCK